MSNRYIKNQNMLSQDENQSLRSKRIAVVGCGGLGGTILEQLARLGIGYLKAIDGDVFEESNLNRQILSNPGNIGKSKVVEAQLRINLVNPDIEIDAVNCFINSDNALALLRGHDLIMDALDSMEGKTLIKNAARELGIPIIYGAIAGWYAHIALICPEDTHLDFIFESIENKGIEQYLGNPAFTPALAASIQVSEAIKFLCNKGTLLRNKILSINLLDNDFQIIEL
ncbi:MAG: HesA/MoeB/ThiF family protein [Bacteroidales bacterium]|nr:HesA/MoeB/ThiF family protein [Bacteroidales bacterium]